MELENIFDAFADETEAELDGMAEKIRLLEERDRSREERIRSLEAQMEMRSTVPVVGVPGPPGKDGADGKDGRDGKDGERGQQGERGSDGINGRDGAPSTVPGPQGERGERGADGIATREELDALIEARVQTRLAEVLADVHRGPWRHGETYERGQTAQCDGSRWVAQTRTTSMPGTSKDWTQMSQRGPAGRDGRK